jgi:hypothetical protein
MKVAALGVPSKKAVAARSVSPKNILPVSHL